MIKDLQKDSQSKCTAIIQARMGSSRLPGKVLETIGGRAMLGWVVERSRRADSLDRVIVATTMDSRDDPVVEYCQKHAVPYYRGDHHDVLDRYYQAAVQFQAEEIVRLTADCPFLDPELIDQAVSEFWAGDFDYVTNRLPEPWGRTFPIGLDVEVFSMEALTDAWQRADQKHHREHVTAFFYDDISPEDLKADEESSELHVVGRSARGFNIKLLNWSEDLGNLRWTVDNLEDLRLVRKMVAYFDHDLFDWQELTALLQNEPDLQAINADVKHKTHRDIDRRYERGESSR